MSRDPRPLLCISFAFVAPVWASGSPTPRSEADAAPPVAAPLSPVATRTGTTDDLAWLDRVTFGADTRSLERLRAIGRARFLDEQLAARDDALPPSAAADVDALAVSRLDLAAVLAEFASRQAAIRAAADDDARARLRREARQRGLALASEAAQVRVLRSVHSPAQLQERMTTFWLDQFSVFRGKAATAWFVGDYAEHAIRPHALGRFRDLVLATLRHPAMLVYLDNARNRAGKPNENFARELMELHVLGVDAGYTQADVQQLARILSGLTLPDADDVESGFVPRRHVRGDKTLLGTTIRGGGIDEIEHAVDLLVAQPACARFVSTRIAQAFVADAPPEALVTRMAATFQRTRGDIGAVMRTLLTDEAFAASTGTRYKDPYRFVVSSLRATDADIDADQAVTWLEALGQAPFTRLTPDGHPLVSTAWTSPGQLAKRFEIAGALAARLPAPSVSSLLDTIVGPRLDAEARAVVASAPTAREKRALQLASPAFNRY